MVSVALLVRFEAQPGKEGEVVSFLRDALPAVEAEEGTTTWFALRFDGSNYGIFDAFPADPEREAHLAGVVAAKLEERAGELFTRPPTIERIDVLASKLPG